MAPANADTASRSTSVSVRVPPCASSPAPTGAPRARVSGPGLPASQGRGGGRGGRHTAVDSKLDGGDGRDRGSIDDDAAVQDRRLPRHRSPLLQRVLHRHKRLVDQHLQRARQRPNRPILHHRQRPLRPLAHSHCRSPPHRPAPANGHVVKVVFRRPWRPARASCGRPAAVGTGVLTRACARAPLVNMDGSGLLLSSFTSLASSTASTASGSPASSSLALPRADGPGEAHTPAASVSAGTGGVDMTSVALAAMLHRLPPLSSSPTPPPTTTAPPQQPQQQSAASPTHVVVDAVREAQDDGSASAASHSTRTPLFRSLCWAPCL
jgi:hypothetical protein